MGCYVKATAARESTGDTFQKRLGGSEALSFDMEVADRAARNGMPVRAPSPEDNVLAAERAGRAEQAFRGVKTDVRNVVVAVGTLGSRSARRQNTSAFRAAAWRTACVDLGKRSAARGMRRRRGPAGDT